MAPSKLVVCTCSRCALNTYSDENSELHNGTWVTNRTCQKHRAAELQQHIPVGLLESMKNMNLVDNHEYEPEDIDDEIEATGDIKDNKNEVMDGESDEDITYKMCEDSPIERE